MSEWNAILAPLGVPSLDGRMLSADEGAITWREPPLTLMLLLEEPDFGGHSGSEVAGTISQVWREGDAIHADGDFTSATDHGESAAQLIADGAVTKVSIDLSVQEVEYVDPDGATVDMEDEDNWFRDDLTMLVSRGVIIGATMVPMPAFEEATIRLTSEEREAVVASMVETGRTTLTFIVRRDAVTAASAPTIPPADWFARAETDEPSALTVTQDGAVYGHIALWDSCHTGYQAQCVAPPRSDSDYSWFELGELETSDGPVPVGRITMNTGHANTRADYNSTIRHYDDSGTVAAYVRASNGKHGVWVCGALNPALSADDVQLFRSLAPSGDWRPVKGRGLELSAVLMVPVPGFPVQRSRALVAGGKLVPQALIGRPVTATAGCGCGCDEAAEKKSRVARLALVAKHGRQGAIEALAASARG